MKCVHPYGRSREFIREELEQSIADLFEQQVARHASRIAVKSRDEALTYEALDAAANRIARAIAGQTPSTAGDHAVALLFGQTIGAAAATLGVLKAGRFYVALAPSHPPDRLVEILNDSKTTLIVTDTRHLPLVDALGGRWPVLNVDSLDGAVAAAPPRVAHSATALAAIFYTSGTTGKPKGVVQDHRSILHRVMIDTNTFQICPDDRLSLLSAACYSVSLRNFFGALLNGATVCPFDFEEEGVSRIATWLIEEQITIYSATPTVFRHFAATLNGDGQFSHVRLINIGGEEVLASDVELYRRHFSPTCILENSLGCNEAGVFRRYLIDKQTVVEGTVMPAGYDVPDKEVVLLAGGKEVASNEVGEIAIKCRYPPRGYWGRPDLTDAAFVPDPRGGEERLYLTGDMGQMLPDGCLIHLGRRDSRVKIRGQFVDLAELEITLRQQDGVDEVVVKALEGPDKRTALVAFIVPSRECTLTTRELRRLLAAKLPAFMVPSRFALLTALPRSANGKVDRQALALPDDTPAGIREIERRDGPAYVPPMETIECQLVEIWEQLLRVHPIGLRDNFFDLGGDSLMALDMIAEVELRCGEAVQVSALLSGATLGEFAQTLVEQRVHRRDSLVIRVQSGDPTWPFFFLHGDYHGGGFYCLNLARALGHEQRFYAVAPHGMSGDHIPSTIEAMAASYVDMIQAVEPEGPYLLGGFCHAGLIAFEMARQLERKGEKVALVAMIAPPAWNPPHWRSVKDAVAAVMSVCRRDSERSTDLFLRFRERRIRLRQFCAYSKKWLRETASMPVSGQIAHSAGKVKRLGLLLREKPWALEPVDPPPTDDLTSAYRRAVDSYVRRPYSGRVALYWPRKMPVKTLGGPPRDWASAPDLSLGWRRIAAQVEVQPLPGDHTTSITTHVQSLASRLKMSIEQARSSQRVNAVLPVRRSAANLGS
jgi:amino acid adenylation domain-containing protein